MSLSLFNQINQLVIRSNIFDNDNDTDEDITDNESNNNINKLVSTIIISPFYNKQQILIINTKYNKITIKPISINNSHGTLVLTQSIDSNDCNNLLMICYLSYFIEYYLANIFISILDFNQSTGDIECYTISDSLSNRTNNLLINHVTNNENELINRLVNITKLNLFKPLIDIPSDNFVKQDFVQLVDNLPSNVFIKEISLNLQMYYYTLIDESACDSHCIYSHNSNSKRINLSTDIILKFNLSYDESINNDNTHILYDKIINDYSLISFITIPTKFSSWRSLIVLCITIPNNLIDFELLDIKPLHPYSYLSIDITNTWNNIYIYIRNTFKEIDHEIDNDDTNIFIDNINKSLNRSLINIANKSIYPNRINNDRESLSENNNRDLVTYIPIPPDTPNNSNNHKHLGRKIT